MKQALSQTSNCKDKKTLNNKPIHSSLFLCFCQKKIHFVAQSLIVRRDWFQLFLKAIQDFVTTTSKTL